MPRFMNLWEGNHLSDAALAQFQQGSLSSEALLEADAHLAGCGECKARLNQVFNQSGGANSVIVSLAQALERENIDSPLPHLAPYVAEFPSFDTIAAYVDGALSSSQIAAFEVALARFPSLSKQVEDLRALRRELNGLNATASANAKAEAETLVVPPMIVRSPVEAKAPQVAWWRRLLWPMQTLGTVGAGALLFAVIWSQQQQLGVHLQQQQQIAQREAQLQGQLSKAQAENRNLSGQRRKNQRQLEASQRQNERVSQQRSEQQRRADALQAQLEESQRQLREAKNGTTPLNPAPAATSIPAPRPTSASSPTVREGSADIAATLRAFIIAQRDSSLVATTTTLRGEGQPNPKLQLLSPVATKVRDLRPVLRWAKIEGATSYEVSLNDETEGEWVFQGQSVTTPPWRLPKEFQLTPGHRYRWEIAGVAKGRVVATSPKVARFQVLTEEENNSLQQKLKAAGNSRPAQISILSAAGLTEEALDRLATDPKR